MAALNWLKLALLLIGGVYALRIPYLLFVATYVSGMELSAIHHEVTKMDIGRGTSTFWKHCLRHTGIAAIIVIFCYFIFVRL